MSKFDELKADFAKDAAKENNGVWMTYGHFQYLIARAHRNNTAFLSLMEKEMRPYQFAIQRENFAALKEVANDLMQKVYAKAILLGIKKIDGTDMEYTPDDGVELFKALPDLWDTIFKFAGEGSNYTPEAVKADSKNS